MSQNILELEQLVFEMQTTNVARGLKVNVHEGWIKRLNNAINGLKQEGAAVAAEISNYEELLGSTLAAQTAAKAVVSKKK